MTNFSVDFNLTPLNNADILCSFVY